MIHQTYPIISEKTWCYGFIPHDLGHTFHVFFWTKSLNNAILAQVARRGSLQGGHPAHGQINCGARAQSRFLGPLQLLLGWSLGVAKNGLSMAMLQWNGVSINGGTPRNKLDKIDGKWGGTHFRKPHAIYSRKLASASWSPYCFSKVLGGLESPIAWNFTLKLPPLPPARWLTSSLAVAQSPRGHRRHVAHRPQIRQHSHPQHRCVFMPSSLPN